MNDDPGAAPSRCDDLGAITYCCQCGTLIHLTKDRERPRYLSLKHTIVSLAEATALILRGAKRAFRSRPAILCSTCYEELLQRGRASRLNQDVAAQAVWRDAQEETT